VYEVSRASAGFGTGGVGWSLEEEGEAGVQGMNGGG